MIVAERGFADTNGLVPIGDEPGMFGIGPVPAVRQALDRAGWTVGDVERIEINEAFAAISLAVTRELGLPENAVNVEGGAIAHGHPIGASGAVLTTRLLHAMKRDGLKRGVVTLCIGGGQGIALALEAFG
jgi:acetyl-CoA C-acetyltransferase